MADAGPPPDVDMADAAAAGSRTGSAEEFPRRKLRRKVAKAKTFFIEPSKHWHDEDASQSSCTEEEDEDGHEDSESGRRKSISWQLPSHSPSTLAMHALLLPDGGSVGADAEGAPERQATPGEEVTETPSMRVDASESLAMSKLVRRRSRKEKGSRAVTLPNDQPSKVQIGRRRWARSLKFRLEPLPSIVRMEGQKQKEAAAAAVVAAGFAVVPAAAGPAVRLVISALGLAVSCALCGGSLLLLRGKRGESISAIFQVDANGDGIIGQLEVFSAFALLVATVGSAFVVTRTTLSAYDYLFFGLHAIRHNRRFRRLEAMSPFQIHGPAKDVDPTIVQYLETHYDSEKISTFAPTASSVRADSENLPVTRRSNSASSDSAGARRSSVLSLAKTDKSRHDTARSLQEFMSLDSCSVAPSVPGIEEQQHRSSSSSSEEDMQTACSRRTCSKSTSFDTRTPPPTVEKSGGKMTSTSSLPPAQTLITSSKLQELIYRMPDWNFDIFEVAENTPRPLAFIGFVCLDAYSRVVDYNKKKLLEFLNDVEDSYRDVPYHNNLHGASVARAVYSFCAGCGLSFSLEYMEVTIVLAGLVHDVHHPGLTPAFLSKASAQGPWKSPITLPLEPADMELAPKYNDQSPLENMHCAITFQLLRKEKNAFLSPEDVSAIRKPLIRSILGTDMAKHAETMTRLVALIDNLKHPFEGGAMPWYWPSKPPTNADEEQRKVWERLCQEEFVMELFLHAADIGNPTLPFDQWVRWNRLVQQEFHTQGDRERVEFGELISPPAGFDRNAGVNAEHAFTKGFMQYLALPLFEQLHDLTQVVNDASVCRGVNISGCVENLRNNLRLWESYVPRVEDEQHHDDDEEDDEGLDDEGEDESGQGRPKQE